MPQQPVSPDQVRAVTSISKVGGTQITGEFTLEGTNGISLTQAGTVITVGASDLAPGGFNSFPDISSNAASPDVKVDTQEFTVRSDDNTFTIVSGGVLVADIGGSGANGLDTGSESSDTWYAIWAIGDSTLSNPTATLLSESFTSPTLPSGYNRKRRIGAVHNDSGSDFRAFDQVLDRVTYLDSTYTADTTQPPNIANEEKVSSTFDDVFKIFNSANGDEQHVPPTAVSFFMFASCRATDGGLDGSMVIKAGNFTGETGGMEILRCNNQGADTNQRTSGMFEAAIAPDGADLVLSVRREGTADAAITIHCHGYRDNL